MDYQAGTPTDPRVLEAMMPYFTETFGNPSSPHQFGQETKTAIDHARSMVAELIGAKKAGEIIFTSSGTESNNLAVRGVAHRNREKGDHVITTKLEHMSVINTCKSLQKEGFKVTFIPVDKYGTVDLERLKSEINERTILVSVMYANGEIGTIEPIRAVSYTHLTLPTNREV